jgi:hypothetical protein
MVHQQRHAGTASRAHRQRDDDTSAARIDAQAYAPSTSIAPPFDASRTIRQRQHFSRRKLHSAEQRQKAPIRQ